MSDAITIKLDRARPIVWGDVAQYRLGTLPRPPGFGDLRNPRKCYAAMIGLLWAALADGAEDFADPESLVQHFRTKEACAAGVQALVAMFKRDVMPDQKKSDS